jgi:hypothetical protein
MNLIHRSGMNVGGHQHCEFSIVCENPLCFAPNQWFSLPEKLEEL